MRLNAWIMVKYSEQRRELIITLSLLNINNKKNNNEIKKKNTRANTHALDVFNN